MANTGRIVAGAIVPHLPHLVYAESPPQNEPRSEGGWEVLRWGCQRFRKSVLAKKPDVLLVQSPYWLTHVGHHVLGLSRMEGFSVDPFFPHLFRFGYDVTIDAELSHLIADEGRKEGLMMKVMKNPDFTLDSASLASAYLVNPAFDIPIVVLSSNHTCSRLSSQAAQEEMRKLGVATRRAVEISGRRAVLLAGNSLSFRHFTKEPDIPEDMSQERIFDHNQYLWDMEVLKMLREGRTRELVDCLPDFLAAAQARAGAFAWMLSALDFPRYPAEVHAYGSIIGTGNAVVEWDHERHSIPLAAGGGR